MNDIILELIKSYPLGGEYYWPKDGSDGVTKTIQYLGENICSPEPQKRTYCCGLTFEIYLRACEKFALSNFGTHLFHIPGVDLKELRKIKADWYVATGKRGGVYDALVPRGLGVLVPFEQAKPGDFCQYWRKNGSGHSAIFLGYTSDSSGLVNGIHYWTTQTSTHGIGERNEKFTGTNPILRDKLYIVRPDMSKIIGV